MDHNLLFERVLQELGRLSRELRAWRDNLLMPEAWGPAPPVSLIPPSTAHFDDLARNLKALGLVGESTRVRDGGADLVGRLFFPVAAKDTTDEDRARMVPLVGAWPRPSESLRERPWESVEVAALCVDALGMAFSLEDIEAALRALAAERAAAAEGAAAAERALATEQAAASERAQAGQPPGLVAGQYVSLDQMAAIVGKSKRTLENLYRKGVLPNPDVLGGGGRAHEWGWANVRLVLQKRFGRNLPDTYPRGR